jgi:hypothetical protein
MFDVTGQQFKLAEFDATGHELGARGSRSFQGKHRFKAHLVRRDSREPDHPNHSIRD